MSIRNEVGRILKDFFENILGKGVYTRLDDGRAKGKLREEGNFEFLCKKEYRNIKLKVLETRRLRRFPLISVQNVEYKEVDWLKNFFEEKKYDSRREIRKLIGERENLNDSNFSIGMYKNLSKLKVFRNSITSISSDVFFDYGWSLRKYSLDKGCMYSTEW